MHSLPSAPRTAAGTWPTWWAARRPDAIAFVDAETGRTCGYARLDRLCRQVAQALHARGVGRGDRVVSALPNCVEGFVLMFAAWRLGAVVVPVNTRLTAEEIAHVLTDSGADVVVTWQGMFGEVTAAAAPLGVGVVLVDPDGDRSWLCVDPDQVGPLEAGPVDVGRDAPVWADPDDLDLPALVMYTAGTTGRPRGAVLTHRNLVANVANAAATCDPPMCAADTSVVAAPTFHIGGLGIQALPLVALGGTNVVMRRFDADRWLDLVAEHRASLVFMVPTMWQRVLDRLCVRAGDLSSVRLALVGGAPCPVPLMAGLAAHGLTLCEGLGMTEAAPVIASLRPEHLPERWGTVGFPAPGMQVQVRDERGRPVPAGRPGVLHIRGENVVDRYWGGPSVLVEGWFATGDVVTQDEQGCLTVVGRATDLIISGGENVYPAEVEQVLVRHPAVRQAVVFGAPDPQWGETVVAVVTLVPGAQLAGEELRLWARERLAHFKCPTRVRVLDELPLNGAGKVSRPDLRKVVRAG